MCKRIITTVAIVLIGGLAQEIVGCAGAGTKEKPATDSARTATTAKAPASELASGAPEIGMYGQRALAHHVCYLIDASGSMMDSFPAVGEEVTGSIRKLREGQDFDTIIVNGGPGRFLENPPRKLTPVTSQSMEEAAIFLLGVRASSCGPGSLGSPGGSETIFAPALRRAFDVLDKASPSPGKVLYLLTDGAFDDANEVAAVAAFRNKKKEVRIYTFLCGHEQESAKAFMEKLAKDNGGAYKHIAEEE